MPVNVHCGVSSAKTKLICFCGSAPSAAWCCAETWSPLAAGCVEADGVGGRSWRTALGLMAHTAKSGNTRWRFRVTGWDNVHCMNELHSRKCTVGWKGGGDYSLKPTARNMVQACLVSMLCVFIDFVPVWDLLIPTLSLREALKSANSTWHQNKQQKKQKKTWTLWPLCSVHCQPKIPKWESVQWAAAELSRAKLLTGHIRGQRSTTVQLLIIITGYGYATILLRTAFIFTRFCCALLQTEFLSVIIKYYWYFWWYRIGIGISYCNRYNEGKGYSV